VGVSNRYAKAALISAWNECLAADPVESLRDKLAERGGLAYDATAGGTVKTTSGNGHAVTFADGGKGAVTQVANAEMWMMLLELFDGVKADIGGDPSDETVEARMEIELRDVRGYVNDFRFLQK
jgi:hypothetical protein